MAQSVDPQASNRRVLGVFTIAMFNVATIVSLSNLPTLAELGLGSIFYLLVAALVFLVPAALVSAELATGWSGGGGIYDWVKAAFGPGWGFLSIWLLWCTYLTFFPTVLSFAAATLTYTWNPALAENSLYTIAVVLVVLWGFTFANFRGMKASGAISSAGVIAGTLVPGALIVFLGVLWFVTGNQSQVSFSADGLLPNLDNIRNVVFLPTVFLFFAGTEVSAVHAREVDNPQRDYPRAILVSSSIIITLYALGTLAVATVVPQGELSLVAGVMEAFTEFLAAYNLSWLVPLLALLIVFGAIGTINAWIIGPTKGLLVTARDGNIPSFFQRANANGIPTRLLVAQALVVSAISLVFLVEPTVSSSFYVLLSLATKLYLAMYILMMASAIRLRYKEPDVERAYRIPGGKVGIWIVAGTGVLSASFAIVAGFFPPAQVDTGDVFSYEAFLAGGILVVFLAALLIYRFSRCSKAMQDAKPEDEP